MQDSDILRLRESIRTRLNLEMANSAAILEFALRLHPDEVCLVPERRQEVTTEGGLDAAGQATALRPVIEKLRGAGVRVSLFIAPDERQIRAASQLEADMVELHTGAFAEATGGEVALEMRKLRAGAILANRLGLQVNAGHGINYINIRHILTLPHLRDLNIGHSIVARALETGFRQAVSQMLEQMSAYEGGTEEEL